MTFETHHTGYVVQYPDTVTEYKISDSPAEIEHLIAHGWQLYGSPSYTSHKNMLRQSLIRVWQRDRT